MTKHSLYMDPIKSPKGHDVLIVEFGSSNISFYGDAIQETLDMANAFKGTKIFLNDDPDLPFLWDKIEKPELWTCWYNAVKPEPLGKQTWVTNCFDMPFSSLMEPLEAKEQYEKDFLVYIGRANSRSKMVKYLIANKAPWKVFGRAEEWADYGIFPGEAPDQPKRAEFYRNQLGCLALADPKHKKMGWRTGRAYHAIMAGCPALIEADHIHLHGFPTFRSVDDINRYFHRWRDPEARHHDWKAQVGHMWHERDIANKTLEAHGL